VLDHSMLVQFRNRIFVPIFQARILASELKTSSGVRHFNRRNVKNTTYSIVPNKYGGENKRVGGNFAKDLISVRRVESIKHYGIFLHL
jgi:hypothetical protein